jgi:type VI secretion system protein ImpA
MTTDIEAELGPLLKPISEAEPCGPAMRSDPVFTEIRLAREEDDPTLPMGQWERPLKKADWALIHERCTTYLATRTKDLQLAAWVLEAWTRQSGWAGLEKGLCLVHELLVRYWDTVHPRIDEDGDSDARVAPLQWLNESLPLTLRVHVPLMVLADRRPPRIALAEWDKLTAAELTGDTIEPAADDADPPVTRADVLAAALADRSGRHVKQLALVRESLSHLAAMTQLLDDKLGRDAPNLHKLRGTLEAVERVVLQFQPPPVAEAPAPPPPEEESLPMTDAQDAQPQPSGDIAPIVTRPPAVARMADVQSREQAYQALEALADYLGQIEPHSPTPYLIRRAVSWGRMPLPELMQEILREEGDLNRMTTLLGLGRDA